ncbi:MAG: PKD domain-containing protein [Chryseolinea sp.]
MTLMFRDSRFLFLVFCLLTFRLAVLADPTPKPTFIENKNQWDPIYQYAVQVSGTKMFLQSGSFIYYFLDEGRVQQLHERGHDAHANEGSSIEPNEPIQGHRLQVEFEGSKQGIAPTPFGRSTAYYNFFLGNDTCRWATDAYGYDGMIYPSLYEGVDLKVYTSGNNIKYDLIVEPQGDPSKISLAYSGADQMFIDHAGDLQVNVSVGQLIEKKPIAYQLIDGRKVNVPCSYRLNGSRVTFDFPMDYDHCYELIIDPLLIFSTYSGSTADNWGSTATPGEHGTLYSAGVTNKVLGGNFPATNGAFQVAYGGVYDVAILKYDSAGSALLYASYLGGSRTESAHSLVVGSDEDLIILGTTSSIDFPTTAGAFDRTFNGGTRTGLVVDYVGGSDIFVSRISKNGSALKASTLIGGSANDGLNPIYGPLTKNYGDEMRGDVITDANNNIYISTVTASADFPIVDGIDAVYNGGGTDALIAKLSPDLSQIIWSTFLGGAGEDASHTIKFDKLGNLFVAGGTTSAAFPVTATAFQATLAGDADGWIANIDVNGTVIYNATFTGTNSFDQVYFLDLNEDDEVYVYGQTTGNFPITAGVYSNANGGQFIQKFDHSLSTLVFSTVIGSGRGIPDISPTAFLVNDCNNIYLSGWGGVVNSQSFYWQSNTIGMPVTPDAFQSTSGGSDFYFMVLTEDASQFLYGTYLGGNDSQTHVDGGTSRFDKGGIVYHAVCSGCRAYNETGEATSDFPTTSNAWSRTNNSTNCNNAAFKFDLSSLKARLQSNSVKLNQPGLNKICIPDPIVFQNFSTGGETFEWDLGDGTRIVKPDTSMVTHQYAATGKYTVWLTAIDKGTCTGKDAVSLKIDVFIADTRVQDDDDVCLDAPYKLQASGGAQYAWTSADGSFSSNLSTPTVVPADTMVYYITITEASGCIQMDTVQLNVIPTIKPSFEMDRSAECFERPAVQVNSTTDSLWTGDRLFFDFGDGSTSDETRVSHEYKEDGLYQVKLVGVREFCVTEEIVPMPVFQLLIPNVITPGQQDDQNDRFTIQYGNVPGTTPRTYGFTTSVIIYNRWGTEVYNSPDYQYDWDGANLAGGVYFYEVTVEGHSTCKSWLQLVK